MTWIAKALMQYLFSLVPHGYRCNYLFQKNVTKSLPRSDNKIIDTAALARRHISAFKQETGCNMDGSLFYEFGAGWDLIIPFAFYSSGVNRQILLDVSPLLRRELINDTISKFQRLPIQGIVRRPQAYVARDIAGDLQRFYGMQYRAPYDAGKTDLKPGSIDCITSTNTLEHIPQQSIRVILQECHRILKGDGLFSVIIDYKDHYSYYDKKISSYNFLRYSGGAWVFLNPSLHYQNRLRHRDYCELFVDAGFDIIREEREDGSGADLEVLRNLPIDKQYRSYTQQELAVRSAHVVLRKSDGR